MLGLPRGGVPVALEVARALGAPLDVIVVRKLGVPYQPELAMGAIGEDGVRVVNDEVVRHARHHRRGVRCRGGDRTDRARTPRTTVPGRPAAGPAASDGPRSWSTTASRRGRRRWPPARSPAPTVRHAWCWRCRWHHLVRRSASAPTSTSWSAWRCRSGSPPWASGTRTSRRRPTSRSSIASPAARPSLPGRPAILRPESRHDPLACDEEVQIRGRGDPSRRTPHHSTDPATGIVVFAHGSGSSRHSRRNRFVAEVLNRAGLGTLLFDLLTADEETGPGERVRRRAARPTTHRRDPGGAERSRSTAGRPIGYFGASTGAAAALWAAATLGADVDAVVSRGGRPDLAGSRLADVTAPTLLIVGSRDEAVLGMNRHAQARLRCENRLAVVPGASHLFEEPGTLDEAAELARDWFVDHLTPNMSAEVGQPTIHPARGQMRLHRRPSPLKGTVGRDDRRVEQPGGLAHRPAQHVAQDQRRTLPAAGAAGGRRRTPARSFPWSRRPSGSGVARRGLVEQAVGIRLQPGELGNRTRRRRLARARPERIEAGGRRDAIQPGPEPRIGVETLALAPRPYERLPHQLIGLVEGPEHPVAVHV